MRKEILKMANKKKIKQNSIRITVTGCPYETTDIFVCGDTDELGNWDAKFAKKMQNDSDGKCSLTVKPTNDGTIRYKYLSAQDWEYVECDANGGYVLNREATIWDKNQTGDYIVRFKI